MEYIKQLLAYREKKEPQSLEMWTNLFQLHEVRTPLYTVELHYSNTLK